MCRHVQVALRHDAHIAFPASLQGACSAIAARLACDDVWQRGALVDALRLEGKAAHGTAAPNGILHALGDRASAFMQAVAILMPLKAFLRALVTLCNDWVRCAHG